MTAAGDGVRPCTPEMAVIRGHKMVGVMMPYALGTGTYKRSGDDTPWTKRADGLWGSDCAGFICWAFQLTRHRPGFNRGGSVEDHINTTSMCEDAERKHELFTGCEQPEVGCLLAYPTFRVWTGIKRLTFIGHVALVVGIHRVAEWDPAVPDYASLDLIHCHGPNGRKPAVTASTGALFDRHDEQWLSWPKRKTRLLNVRRALP